MNKAFKNIKLVVQMNNLVGLLWNLGELFPLPPTHTYTHTHVYTHTLCTLTQPNRIIFQQS